MRLYVEGLSQHILLKSLNDLIIFKDEEDYETFIGILRELSTKDYIDIHAYVLKPTYFEFLATPKFVEAMSKHIQSLGRKYVAYYNKKYNRAGTIWEGRYRSSLLDDSIYLFDVMKYIECKASNYSSVGKNLYDKYDNIVVYHRLYKKLGFTQSERIKKYSTIFHSKNDLQKEEFIKECLLNQAITGSNDFIKILEDKTKMKLISNKRGRPKKQTNIKGKKMYKNLVVLDKETHKELKINPMENLDFARGSAFVPLVGSEVKKLSNAFPIVFSTGEKPTLMALVSLGGDSLAINSEGKWISKYVPAHIRKYPFSFASAKDKPEQKVILIDEDSKLFSKSKGKKLFKKSGEQSESLENAIKFLSSYEKEIAMTDKIVEIITQSGILEDREISVGEGDEKKVLVSGFQVVSREKLNKLSDDILAEWVRNGIIFMIDAHLKSLENIQTLFDLAQQRQS